MKKQINGILTLLLALVVQIAFAQDRTISGVVSDDSGLLPGVSILKKGTTQGVETNFDGKYTIQAKTGDVLVFSFVGMDNVEKTVGSSNKINVTMVSSNVLEEVIVTGVAGATSKKKLAISAESVSEELLSNVPGTSAGSALQGKVAGVNVVQPSGLPGSSPSITIRGATSLLGNQDPLIIVDGTLLASGNLSDINSEDIKSFEVLKGAAAASLYGSKAANGVIQIITKRGKGLGKTVVTFRNEIGITSILKQYEVNRFHSYKLNNDGSFARNTNGGLMDDIPQGQSNPSSSIIDNPYPVYYDNFNEAYGSGLFRTTSISIAGGSEKINYYASFQDYENEGIVKIGDLAYNRKTGKVNLDFDISDKISISTSNSYSESKSNEPAVGEGSSLNTLQFTPPHFNLTETNQEDGSLYNWDIFEENGWPSAETNPFYYLYNDKRNTERDRLISNIKASYKPVKWLTLSATYGLDNLNTRFNQFVDKTWLDTQVSSFVDGRIRSIQTNFRNENLQFDATTNNEFGMLDMTIRLQALQENQHFEKTDVLGSKIAIQGINNLENVEQANLNVGSSRTQEVAQSYAGILNLIYNDRYIFDGLARYERVSTYGPLARNQWFYRVAGAYRIGLDLDKNWINELKLRASYGTSGLRPPYEAQYEVLQIRNGRTENLRFGNAELGPSISKEFEVGLNFDFLDRFRTSFTFSNTNNEGLVILVPQSAVKPFPNKYVNAGSIKSTVYEASLGIDIIKKEKLNWNFNVLFSKNKAKITEFERSDFQTGPSSAFLLRSGEEYGSFYGVSFLKSLDKLPAGTNLADYKIYKGLVVTNDGTNTPVLEKDTNGNDLVKKIGNTTPDFNMSFNTSLSYKNFSLYALLDWQKGGDVYNQTKQFRYRELSDPSIAGETVGYASGLYSINKINDFFVEDASFIKLREVSLRYDFLPEFFNNTFIEGMSIGVAGRNLFIISDYTGLDPEVSDISVDTSGNNTNDLTSYRFDAFGYPSTKTFTGSITIKF